jgi:heterodisulfide reductase subunit C
VHVAYSFLLVALQSLWAVMSCKVCALRCVVRKLSISDLLNVFRHVNVMPSLSGGVIQSLLAVSRILCELAFEGKPFSLSTVS